MPASEDEWSDLDFQVNFSISDSPVHPGVQQGRGVLVYRGGPLIVTKKGVRAPGNDIRPTRTDSVHIHSHSCVMEAFVSGSCDRSPLFIHSR